jgi:hypothetical protein
MPHRENKLVFYLNKNRKIEWKTCIWASTVMYIPHIDAPLSTMATNMDTLNNLISNICQMDWIIITNTPINLFFSGRQLILLQRI